ncbi:MAG: hypothetical protein COB35_03195 [Gammaproteobacteria bacterium]|nr:MAG: hypothetical protein COB35_03195 [Gammaproteobacteria bacterium]
MKIKLNFISVVLLFSLFSLNIFADDHNDAQKLVKSGEILSLEIILKELRKTSQGRVIEVELERKNSQLVYEIEVLNVQGEVLEYVFAAKTGKLISKDIEN